MLAASGYQGLNDAEKKLKDQACLELIAIRNTSEASTANTTCCHGYCSTNLMVHILYCKLLPLGYKLASTCSTTPCVRSLTLDS